MSKRMRTRTPVYVSERDRISDEEAHTFLKVALRIAKRDP